MAGFASIWIFSYALWMLLSCGNGGSFLGFLPGSELYLGLWVATAAAFLSRGLFGPGKPHGALSPLRFLRFVRYVLCDFFPELAKANLLVAKAVITGRIDPGILRVKTHLTRDEALTALANSITLTPGTLTVRVDDATNDLFVHFLNLPPGADEENDTLEADCLFEVRPCVRAIRNMYGEALPEPPKAPETPENAPETPAEPVAEAPEAPEMPEKAPETAEKPAERAEQAPESAPEAEKPAEMASNPPEKAPETAEMPAETPQTAPEAPETAPEAPEAPEKPAEMPEKPGIPPEPAPQQPETAPEVAP